MLDKKTRKIIKESPKGTIIINLDGNIIYNCVSLKDFKLALKERKEYITTPLTTALDNCLCLDGYKLIVQSEGRERCINDMLLGDIGPNEKELRLAHNIEKMILGGLYDIETEWKNL